MSTTTKVVLGVVGGVALLCLVGAAMASLGFAAGRMSPWVFPTQLGIARSTEIMPRYHMEWNDELPYGRGMQGGRRLDGGRGDPMRPYNSPDRPEWMMPEGSEGVLPQLPGDMPFFGGMRGGMMWSQPTGDPVTFDQALKAAEAYLADLDIEGLTVAEVMIFDNHAYVEVMDAEGQGAIELLVFPGFDRAFLEFGPSMMWNTVYGMHGELGPGGMPGRGMMVQPQPSGEVTVTTEQARQAAQAFLDEAFPGRVVDEDVEAFPGYYTLHVLEDGEIVGMLSVNGYTGNVWYHHWHGELLEMQEAGG
jgi:hypothetical protein